ncbi:MAG: polysaccharide pyruvyl transferase CsaB [bacterium]|nr:polysaccharide pyruvyl transferase CsaB [bacterium]
MKKEFDVLLLGYYGFGNLGDELLAEAAVALLREAGVKRERIAVLSASPADSEKKLGVRAFNRWKMSAAVKACAKSRTLLLGGGGLFQDSTSLRSCLYYCAVMLAAKACGLKIWAEGQSVGPLNSKAAHIVTRLSLSLCSHLSVRDEASLKKAGELGLRAEFIPDLVMSLRPEKNAPQKPWLLFNARPGHEALARAAAERCRALAEANGWEVRGVALSGEDAAEIAMLQDLQYIKIRDIITVRNIEDFSAAARDASGAIGMRLHFLVLCRLAGVPAAGCAYDPKVSGFCMRYNIGMIDDGSVGLRGGADDIALSEARETVREKFTAGLRSVLGDVYGQ